MLNALRIKWFYTKMLFITGGILFLVVIGLGFFAAVNAANIVKERQLNNNRQMLDELYTSLQGNKQCLNQTMMKIYENSAVTDMMHTIYNTGEDEDGFFTDPFFKQYANNLIMNLLYKEKDIQMIMFYNSSAKTLVTFNPTFSAWESLSDNSDIFKYFQEVNKRRIISGTRKMNEIYSKYTKMDFYTISSNIGTKANGLENCIIMIAFDVSKLSTILRKWEDTLKGDTFIINTRGEIVFDSTNRYYGQIYPNLKVIADEQKMVRIGKNQYFITKKGKYGDEYMAFNLIEAKDMAEGYQNAVRTIVFAVLIALLAVIAADVFAIRVSGRRTNQLIRAMGFVGKNNLEYRMPLYNKNDEFDQIAQKFNDMCDDLKENIQRMFIYQIKEKNAELAELQATINPHFLYNTLESIREYMVSGENENASEMITSLASVYRSIVKKQTFIAINEEIDLCHMIFEMYGIRFCNQVETEINVEKEIVGFGIIKNLLQPMIENYFQHGIDLQKDENKLSIHGSKKGDNIEFTICDNGLGIDGERLEDIRKQLEKTDISYDDQYGLANVNERSKIVFGPDCGITLDSIPGKQTVILLRIKALTCEQLKAIIKNPLS